MEFWSKLTKKNSSNLVIRPHILSCQIAPRQLPWVGPSWRSTRLAVSPSDFHSLYIWQFISKMHDKIKVIRSLNSFCLLILYLEKFCCHNVTVVFNFWRLSVFKMHQCKYVTFDVCCDLHLTVTFVKQESFHPFSSNEPISENFSLTDIYFRT